MRASMLVTWRIYAGPFPIGTVYCVPTMTEDEVRRAMIADGHPADIRVARVCPTGREER